MVVSFYFSPEKAPTLPRNKQTHFIHLDVLWRPEIPSIRGVGAERSDPSDLRSPFTFGTPHGSWSGLSLAATFRCNFQLFPSFRRRRSAAGIDSEVAEGKPASGAETENLIGAEPDLPGFTQGRQRLLGKVRWADKSTQTPSPFLQGDAPGVRTQLCRRR